MTPRRNSVAALFVLLTLFLLTRAPVAHLAGDTLPAALTDKEFWSLSEQVSEPNGFFRSNSGSNDNLLSNENDLSDVARSLAERMKPGGVYLGVGPEQNFTYIAAMRPKIALITDIRRGNLHLHLLYKALFEMSSTRAEFVGRLFSRRQPAGLTASSTAADLMSGYLRANPIDEAAFKANLKAVSDHLTRTRALPLGQEDVAGIEYVYRSFYRFGPGINYTSSINGRSGVITGSYAQLMASRDYSTSAERSYLASEGNFAFVKTMESSNLIVPVVGDFAGPRALRAVGTFLKDRGAVVSAFYVSNVEDYLRRSGVWSKFCANVASLPLDANSIFIRPGGRASKFSSMSTETRYCGAN